MKEIKNKYSLELGQYVRQTFDICLPHSKTIRAWQKSTAGMPGFTSESFQSLKIVASTADHPLLCALLLDEMVIWKHLEYNEKQLREDILIWV